MKIQNVVSRLAQSGWVVRAVGLMICVAPASVLASVGQPTVGGTGCANAQAEVSSDGRTVRLKFSPIVTDAGYVSDLGIDRKTCSVAVPVQTPAGYRVKLPRLGVHGFIKTVGQGEVRVSTETFFAGQSNPAVASTLKGTKEIWVKNPSLEQAYSACGEDVNMRANVSVLSQAKLSERAKAFIDRIYFSAIEFVPCN